MRPLDPLCEQYKKVGYAVLPGLYSEAQMDRWRHKFMELKDEYDQWWFGNTLEYAPNLFWPAVSHPTILDFAEKVMGPFVQLDNLTLAGSQPVSKEEAEGKVSGWHRDRWGKVPHIYERPNAINAIAYLQDLTDAYGPLRVLPGSHQTPVTLPEDKRQKPHPDELVIHMKAGDVCMTHGNLVHSGTPNTADGIRFFFSSFYNLSWLKHTDTHKGPLTQRLVDQARERNDHRLMRLLGVDEQLQARCNSRFLIEDEVRWAEWIEADRAAIVEPDA